MIKGIVPDFGYDVKLAVVVDNKKQDNVPERGLYKTNVSCNNNATGEWDYNAWNLKLDNVSEGTKCNLEFTSNLTEKEYQDYLEKGITYRRNNYRGKNITSLYNSGDLYEQIGNCTFDDIYVGDYIKTNTNGKEVTWLIADLNNYLHTGNTDVKSDKYPNQEGGGLEICHATIIPATPLENAKMNNTNTTGVVNDVTSEMPGYGKGAYYGSYMKNVTLPKILKEYITPAFNGHIITYTNLLANQVDPNRYGQFGYPNGASSDWGWYESQVDLISEVNVYGTMFFSSSMIDIGNEISQYAIFELKPEYKNSYKSTRFTYWLSAVVNASNFNVVDFSGPPGSAGASNLLGVRPRFLID